MINDLTDCTAGEEIEECFLGANVQPIGKILQKREAETMLCRNETLGTFQCKLFKRIKGN
jgi:hypothetical protein